MTAEAKPRTVQSVCNSLIWNGITIVGTITILRWMYLAVVGLWK